MPSAVQTTPVYIRTVGCTVDGGGSAITTGKVKGFYTSPVSGTITGWSIGADTGNATVQVWKVATGTNVPTASNNISTSGVALATGTYIHSLNVADFTSTTVNTDDIFAFNIKLINAATELTVALEITS